MIRHTNERHIPWNLARNSPQTGQSATTGMRTIATVIRKKDATASCYKDWYKVKLAHSTESV